jgi:hypothetical protein
VLEALLTHPVVDERRTLALHEVAGGEIVQNRVAGDGVERALFRDVARLTADDDRKLRFPVDLF